MSRRRIQDILTGVFLSVAALAVVVTALVTIALFRSSAQDNVLNQMEKEADATAALISQRFASRPLGPPRRIAFEAGERIRFVESRSLGADPVAVAVGEGTRGRVAVSGKDLLYVARDLDEGRLFILRQSEEAGLPEGALLQLGLAGAVALLLAAGAASVVARRISAPIRELAVAARGLAAGDPIPEAGPHAPAEVAELTDELRDASSQLEQARSRERTFLMNVSHEFRTPLTAVRGWSDAIAESATDDPAHAAAVISSETARLERMVSDLLDLSRLQAGRFPVDLTTADPSAVVERAVAALQPHAHDIRLSAVIEEPADVQTDPDRLQQLITNLAENAIRVTTDGGGVTITSSGTRVDISDTGPGLDDEDLAHLYDRFHLWNRYRNQRQVGSGLGMAIVAELAEALNIEIDVETSDAGTTYHLNLPPAN